jgi:hypothetical protein
LFLPLSFAEVPQKVQGLESALATYWVFLGWLDQTQGHKLYSKVLAIEPNRLHKIQYTPLVNFNFDTYH